MSERTEQEALFDFLARLEGIYPYFKYVFHPANEASGGGKTVTIKGRRVPTEALSNARMGVRKGAWDVWAPFRNQAGIFGYPAGWFVGLVIEMKSERGDLSPAQKEWREFLRHQGWACEVYRAWPDAARTLVRWVGGNPEEIQGL
jgi:hypothetical protein